MDKFKRQIQQRLIANIIIDKCVHSEYLIFRDAWCTQDRVIRFTTPFFRELFSYEENENGKWKTGDTVMYEVQNRANSLTVRCILNENNSVTDTILHTWKLTSDNGDVNKLFQLFDDLLEKEIPRWEHEFRENTDASAALKEGAAVQATLSKYERNPKARAECLAAHGTACVICGIDFAKAYGPEFSGKIEVHHIVPISEIGKEYVVDPVKDLVPICPNCHTAIHGKPGGVYTVEELKALRFHQLNSNNIASEIKS